MIEASNEFRAVYGSALKIDEESLTSILTVSE